MPLANLLNAVGGTLQPKVFCVQEMADQGAEHPDFGLYMTQQVQKGKPKSGHRSRDMASLSKTRRTLQELGVAQWQYG